LIETASSEIPSSSYTTLTVQVDNVNAGAATVTVDGRFTKSLATTDARIVFSTDLRSTTINNQTIEIRGTSAATASYTVTAWLDANNNAVVDNGEYSAVQTVKFLGAADLTATTSFLSSPTYTSDARSLSVRTELTNVNTNQTRESLETSTAPV